VVSRFRAKLLRSDTPQAALKALFYVGFVFGDISRLSATGVVS